ncbi:2Fe-2S iron-sulfur cluster-binding protein [Chromobacterium sphagni]|nr:2Fe-2S iron-sulfur cluster-binding protein [Chromobacterium sphagni]
MGEINMPTIIFENPPENPQTAQIAEGTSLASACDASGAPVPFHCRRGNCGTCRVAVLDGAEMLAVADAHERSVLAVFGLSAPAHRLACQVQMLEGAGQIRLRPHAPRMPRAKLLRVPLVLDARSGRFVADLCDERTGAIVISGMSELQEEAVVVVEFQARGEDRSREVIARIVGYEASAIPNGYDVALELLEHDALLTELFQAHAPATSNGY